MEQPPTLVINEVAEKKKLTKEERKALREAEKARPKRKYIKKADRMVGIKVTHEPILITFD